jgi:hypothetical protein
LGFRAAARKGRFFTPVPDKTRFSDEPFPSTVWISPNRLSINALFSLKGLAIPELKW